MNSEKLFYFNIAYAIPVGLILYALGINDDNVLFRISNVLGLGTWVVFGLLVLLVSTKTLALMLIAYFIISVINYVILTILGEVPS